MSITLLALGTHVGTPRDPVTPVLHIGYGAAIDVSAYSTLRCTLTVSAAGIAGSTLETYLETSSDGSTGWRLLPPITHDLLRIKGFERMTAAGGTSRRVYAGFDAFVRPRFEYSSGKFDGTGGVVLSGLVFGIEADAV